MFYHVKSIAGFRASSRVFWGDVGGFWGFLRTLGGVSWAGAILRDGLCGVGGGPRTPRRGRRGVWETVGRIRRRAADSPDGVSCCRCVLRGKGKPFPYNGASSDAPNGLRKPGCCCAARRVGAPYGTGADSPGVVPCRGRVLRGTPGTAFPAGGFADSPGVESCLWRVQRGMSGTPSPTVWRMRFLRQLAWSQPAGGGVPTPRREQPGLRKTSGESADALRIRPT